MAAGLLLLLFVVALAAWIYVSANRASILDRVKTEINNHIRGELHFDDLHIAFFHSFPNLSVRVSNIQVRDSLWRQHHHTLFQAREVYVSLSLFRLIGGKTAINKLYIDSAAAYLYTDSTGYTNTAIFRPSANTKKRNTFSLPEIEIYNSDIVIELETKNKLFSFSVAHLLCEPDNEEAARILNLDMSVMIHTLSFNRSHGGFAENKIVSGKFELQFNPASKILQFEKINLLVNRQPFVFTGKFFLGSTPVPYTLSIQTSHIPYAEAASLVAMNIRKKLNEYSLSELASVRADLDETDPDNHKTKVRVKITVDHNNITTPIVAFSQTSFTGYFINEWKPGQGRGDDNSGLRFINFSGSWQNIPLSADSINIYNLLHPVLICHLHSRFDINSLNDLYEGRDVQLTTGKGKLDVRYQGPLSAADSAGEEKKLQGKLELDSAGILFDQKNFLLSDISGSIVFSNKDLLIDRLNMHAGSTELTLSGSIRNAYSLIRKGPDAPVIQCSLSSPLINVKDFTPLLKKKSLPRQEKKAKQKSVKIVTEVFSVFNDNDALLELNAKQLVYKKFLASNCSAELLLKGDEVILNHAALEHGGGALLVQGSMLNGSSNNPVDLQVQMTRVDINKVFTAFDNFGQHGILDKNLKGKLDADIRLHGMITDQASILPHSMKGTIDFRLVNGELIEFEPVEKIGSFVFKNRDFSNIQFAVLKDKFLLDGEELTVNRMEIHSNVLVMFVEGVYDFSKGTDMSLQVPLSNIKDPKKDIELHNIGVDAKTGVSVRLRAKTGDDGKLKVTWDPFKKALKKSKDKKGS